MNAIAEIKSRLGRYPKAALEEKEGYICVLPTSETGFDVWFSETERDYTVGFSCWHEHFDKNEFEDALDCFAWGLSDACRLKVFTRNEKEYKWVVQSCEDNNWFTFSTTSLFNFSFWRKKSISYKKNKLLGQTFY